jgi:protein MAK11
MAQTMEHRSKFHDMCYYKVDDKEYVISGHEDKTIRMWDVATGECVAELQGHAFRVKTLTTIESQGVTVLISTSSDGWIKCWDTKQVLEKKGKDVQELGDYNTKSRITCCVAHQGFVKQQEEEEEEGQKETQ